MTSSIFKFIFVLGLALFLVPCSAGEIDEQEFSQLIKKIDEMQEEQRLVLKVVGATGSR